MVSSTPRPHFTPEKDPTPILQEARWAPGPVWTGGKSRPHGNSIPDCPARSQSLYRLSYPVHNVLIHTHTHTHTHTHINTHTYTHTHTHTNTLTHTYTHSHTQTDTYTHTLTHSHTQTHTHTHTHAHSHTRAGTNSACIQFQ